MCEENNENHMPLQSLKIISIIAILFSGFFGAISPVIFAWCSKTKHHENRIQAIMKVLTYLSIGIVLATAMIHMLPDGIKLLHKSNSIFKSDYSINITNDTFQEKDSYPYGFLFAMVSTIVIYAVSTEINWYGNKRLKEISGKHCDEHEEERHSALIKLYILEIAVAVHSIIIGLTLGISCSYKNITTLFIVLCIHQFFEGLAIGSLGVMAHLTFWKAIGFVSAFAITTPVGIGIGMITGNKSPITQGVLSTISAGILLHMALCDMLSHALGSHEHHAHGPLRLNAIRNNFYEALNNDDQEDIDNTDNSIRVADSVLERNYPTPVRLDSGINNSSDFIQIENNHQNHIGKFNDYHKEDESFYFRMICYFFFIIGAGIQSVLGIWG
jgi:solute carrier family 39 (zinc transporter), member 1/2/3